MGFGVAKKIRPVTLGGASFSVRAPEGLGSTLPETNMETKKGPIKSTVLLKWYYTGFHVSLGECRV